MPGSLLHVKQSNKRKYGHMKTLRAYKTELDPNNEQRTTFVRYAGAARFCFNMALADRIERYKAGLTTNRFEQKHRFNALKKEQFPWLAEVAYTVQEQAFVNLDKAYQNFFRHIKKGDKKKGFPKFKSKKRGLGTFTLRANIYVEPRRIKLPVIGWVRLKESDYLPKEGVKIFSATVSERAHRWFISLQVEQERSESAPCTGPAIGVDMGLKALAVCSDGTVFENPRTLVKYERKLKRTQRELSRRQKGSKNRAKSRRKVAKLHFKIANIRQHALHQISDYLTAKAKPSTVVIEDLHVKGMMKNGHLSKAIGDAAWAELRRQLAYKCQWQGIDLIVADRFYPSSKVCSACGDKKPLLKLSERTFVCEACGMVLDRDMNASRNLENLAAKRAVTACEEGSYMAVLDTAQVPLGEAGTQRALGHQSETTLMGSPRRRATNKC